MASVSLERVSRSVPGADILRDFGDKKPIYKLVLILIFLHPECIYLRRIVDFVEPLANSCFVYIFVLVRFQNINGLLNEYIVVNTLSTCWLPENIYWYNAFLAGAIDATESLNQRF